MGPRRSSRRLRWTTRSGYRLIGDAEVSEAQRVVPRFLHRPQHQRGNRTLLGRAAHAVDQLLEVFRRNRQSRRAETVPKRLDERFELGHLLHVGRLVHPMQRRHDMLDQVSGNGLVGQEHELLDQPVRDVALGGDDRLDLPVLGQDHLRLGQVEVD